MPVGDRPVAIVTGAGRPGGIGRAVARRLLAGGFNVVVSDLASGLPGRGDVEVAPPGDLGAAAGDLGGADAAGEVATVACDVRDEVEVDALVAATVERFGRVDCLVAGAGLAAGMRPVVELSLDDWRLNLDVMATGVFLTARAVARELLRTGRPGRIVVIASQAGKTGQALLGAYSAAKFAAIGLVQSLALELGPAGITVNAVCPGTIDTPLLGVKGGVYETYARSTGRTEDEYRARLARSIPTRRFGTAAEVAAAVAFLCSDDAAFVTGASLNVTGGQEVH